MRANRAMAMAVLVLVVTTGRADGADTAAATVVRRLVVSIADRKLAVVENDQVVEVFAVAVGAPKTPMASRARQQLQPRQRNACGPCERVRAGGRPRTTAGARLQRRGDRAR